jgi:hypothetical protein
MEGLSFLAEVMSDGNLIWPDKNGEAGWRINTGSFVEGRFSHEILYDTNDFLLKGRIERD